MSFTGKSRFRKCCISVWILLWVRNTNASRKWIITAFVDASLSGYAIVTCEENLKEETREETKEETAAELQFEVRAEPTEPTLAPDYIQRFRIMFQFFCDKRFFLATR
jgi:hypothetical protein